MKSVLILLILFVFRGLAENVQYVQPNASSPDECPGQPCLTLDQYIQESSKYFTTASTFLFLPGNHSLKASLNMTAVSNISFMAMENSTATITCSETVTVDDVNGLYIEELTFVLHLVQQEGIRLSAFSLVNSTAVITNTVFEGRMTGISGRAIDSAQSNVTIVNCLFEGNTGSDGGAIYAQKLTSLSLTGSVFTRNQASRYGGAIYGQNSIISSRGNNFSHNSGIEGGGAVYCSECNLTLYDYCTFHSNSVTGDDESGGGAIGMRGGNITAEGSFVDISNNRAARGGGISLIGVNAILNTQTLFAENTAKYGGGLYASSTNIDMKAGITCTFAFNSAAFGGAMYLMFGATLSLDWYTVLNTTGNRASEYGGAIYHWDSITDIQCRNVSDLFAENNPTALTLPSSFLQINEDASYLPSACPKINSYNDSAAKDGNFLYGGLLDRSRLRDVASELPYEYFTSSCSSLNISSQNSTTNDISSKPFQLRFYDEEARNIEVYRGQRFSLSIMAVAQGGSIVSTKITASVNSTARLKLNQSSQRIPAGFSNVTYNLYSAKSYEEMTVYPDGPCETIGEASTVINVTFLPCPDAFNQSREECVCEDRLERLNATCMIDDEVVIMRFAGARFWMNASYNENGSYNGLILSLTCPEEYCVTDTVAISLDNPDVQCAFHRSGVLCGQCATNFSLILGGSRCQICSNIHLLLILPFAVAGIALVILLSITRLTVSTGTINSLILYANIVQVNKRVFFPSNEANILTVFIAWINLDLGFETCFFDGMDTFSKMFLQFVFPAYVWILAILIILMSRYSPKISKLIGPDPIAILATLLLISYSKVLKVVMDILSSVNLEHPEGRHVTVWLRDGDLLYFRSKHLILSVLAILVLIFLIIPYTLLTLLGSLLYQLPCRRHYYWLVIRIKPLLDCYYSPYKPKTRFWTGFLLLVRCFLYIIFSYNSLDKTNYSLLAIIVAFSTVSSITWLTKGLYQYCHVDVVEIFIYVNLIILSATAATLPELYKEIATYILVGIILAITIGVTLHQIHLSYFAKTATWLKINSKITSCCGQIRDSPQPVERDLEPLIQPSKSVSTTVINLHSPI